MPRSSQTVALVTALVASVALSSAFADIVVKKPGAASPKTDLGDEELQKNYDAMWEGYGEATANTSDTLTMALSGFQKKAQEDGNLDLALVWSDMLKSFTENGQAKWDNGAEAKKDWKAQFSKTPFPSTPFPDEIANTLEQCNKDYRAAKEDLAQSYDELVKAVTMKGNLDQAQALREEKEKVLAGPVVQPNDPTRPQKPPSWSEGVRDALSGITWLHKNQDRYTFRRDGTYVLEGTRRGGKYAIVEDEKVVILRWNNDPGCEVINVAEAPEKWWMAGGPFREVNDAQPIIPIAQRLIGEWSGDLIYVFNGDGTRLRTVEKEGHRKNADGQRISFTKEIAEYTMSNGFHLLFNSSGGEDSLTVMKRGPQGKSFQEPIILKRVK